MQFGKIVVNIILVLSCIMVKSHPIRQKRSFQYFFDGLVSGYNEKRKSLSTSRNLFDFGTSPLATLAKLSTVSMKTKTEPIKDHIEMESQLVDDRRKANLPRNRSAQVIDNDLSTSNEKTNTTTLKKSRKSMQSKRLSSENVSSHVNASLNTPTPESKDDTVVPSEQSTLQTDKFTTHAMTTPATPNDGTSIATPTETNTILRKTMKVESEKCFNPLIDTENEKTETPLKSSQQFSAVIFLIPLATDQMDEHENKDCKKKRPQSLSLYDDASKFLIPVAIDLHTNIDQISPKEMKIRQNKLQTLHGLPIVHLIN